MASRLRAYVFAAGAILYFAVPAAHGAAGVPQSPSVEGEPESADASRANALIRAGRYAEALAVLRPLTEGPVVDANLVFLRGLAALEGSQQPGVAEDEGEALLDEAVDSFRSMLVARPELVRVRLELARTFFLQRKDSLAREHFERVLAGDLPPGVAANVRSFLFQIRARRRWRAYFGATIAPDSNIGSGSEEEFIEIIGLPFRRAAEDLPTSGVGLSMWTGGEYVHPLGPRTRIRAGGDLSRREYPGSKFDQTTLAAHLGPRWLIGPRSEVSVLASARRRLVELSDDYDELGIRVEAGRRLTPRVSGNARLSWHDRRGRAFSSSDGPVRDLSLGAHWVATPTLRLNASVGYATERPEIVRSRFASRRLRVGAQWALPRGFSVGGSAGIRWTDFEGVQYPPTKDGLAREDRTRTLSASFHHRRFTLYGFSPKVTVTNETRSTNAQALDYRRTRAELSFVRQF